MNTTLVELEDGWRQVRVGTFRIFLRAVQSLDLLVKTHPSPSLICERCV